MSNPTEKIKSTEPEFPAITQTESNSRPNTKDLSQTPTKNHSNTKPHKNPKKPQKFSQIPEDPEYPKFSITWSNLKISIKSTGKSIIQSFSGNLQSGSLVAIIGASGCGKTTFMNYISGYTKDDLETDCNLKINDIKMKNIKALKRISGYVFQEDVLIPELTVFETLIYQAKLKLPIGSFMLKF